MQIVSATKNYPTSAWGFWWESLFPSCTRYSAMTHEQRRESQQQEGLYEYDKSGKGRSNQFGGWSGLWYERVFPNDERHALGVYLPMNIYLTREKTWWERNYLLRDCLDKKTEEILRKPEF